MGFVNWLSQGLDMSLRVHSLDDRYNEDGREIAETAKNRKRSFRTWAYRYQVGSPQRKCFSSSTQTSKPSVNRSASRGENRGQMHCSTFCSHAYDQSIFYWAISKAFIACAWPTLANTPCVYFSSFIYRHFPLCLPRIAYGVLEKKKPKRSLKWWMHHTLGSNSRQSACVFN